MVIPNQVIVVIRRHLVVCLVAMTGCQVKDQTIETCVRGSGMSVVRPRSQSWPDTLCQAQSSLGVIVVVIVIVVDDGGVALVVVVD